MNKQYSKQTPKIYKFNDVITGSIIGGPFAAAYFYYRNYKNYGYPKRAWVALLSFAIGITGLLLVLAYVLPDSVPRAAFTALYAGIVAGIAQCFMKPLTDLHKQQNLPFYNPTRAAVHVLLWLTVFMVTFFGSFWIYFKTIDESVTLKDTFSLIALSSTFDDAAFVSFEDQVLKNDARALEELEKASNTDSAQDDQRAAEFALQLYASNNDVLSKFGTLKSMPSIYQKRVVYLKNYNALRIEQLGYVRAYTLEGSPEDPSNPNLIKADQIVDKIGTLNADQK